MPIFTLVAIVFGVFAGVVDFQPLSTLLAFISEVFIRALKLLSMPIIFLSLVVTISGMSSGDEARVLLRRVFGLTLLTTIAAASVALVLFLFIEPAGVRLPPEALGGSAPDAGKSYLEYVLNIIPSNWVQPFVEGNVLGVLLIALLLSFAILSLDEEHRLRMHGMLASLYEAVMKITKWLVQVIPIAVCAFVFLFVKDLQKGANISQLGMYLVTIVLANLMQALVVLPLLLRFYGVSPWRLFKSMMPALQIAFFSKSSSCTMPLAIECAEERANISPRTARFVFPLCTTINMNACAGFILITVMFVGQTNGVHFSIFEAIAWVLIATISAVGNAGVPMGCFFLTSALLATMNVPLTLMGVILPFYGLLDMLETAINVWSDSCVAAAVDSKEINYDKA